MSGFWVLPFTIIVVVVFGAGILTGSAVGFRSGNPVALIAALKGQETQNRKSQSAESLASSGWMSYSKEVNNPIGWCTAENKFYRCVSLSLARGNKQIGQATSPEGACKTLAEAYGFKNSEPFIYRYDQNKNPVWFFCALG